MDATKCLNNSQWEQYAQQNLGETEYAALLHHAAHCEICLDIKEGIDQLKKPTSLGQTVERINARVDAKLAAPKSKVIPIYFWLSAAAIFIVSLGVVFFPLPKLQDTAVVQQDLDNNKANLPSSDAQINTSKKEVLVQPEIRKPKTKRIQALPEVDLKTESSEDLPLPSFVTATESEGMPVQEEVKALKQLSVSAKAFESKKQGMILPANNMNNRNTEQVLNLDMHTANYWIDSANYKLALALIAQEDYTLALEKLQLLSLDTNFNAEAFWLQAGIYAKKGDLLAQKEALRKLIQLNGKYKKEAALLLND